ncbi:C2 domain-containing protein, partial [Baffinella frigidus]
MPYGKLHVIVFEAKGLPAVELISKNDPFCKVTLMGSNQVVTTPSVSNAGASVRWEHAESLNVIEGQDELVCEVWDYNSFSRNELISAGRHSIIPACQKPGPYDAWCTLKDAKGRPGGELRLILHFQSS